MASTINGTSTGSGGLISTGDDSGILNIQTNETTAITIDASQVVTFAKQPAGTFAGTGPAFSAYANVANSLATGGATKVLFDTEIFDTNNNFASSRFTPTVAGYYQLSTTVGFASFQSTETILAFYKNGSLYRLYNDQILTRLYYFGTSDLIYCNGTTDYIEVYVYQYSGSSVNTSAGSTVTSFSGVLVRSA
jgi:hypothetical protein